MFSIENKVTSCYHQDIKVFQVVVGTNLNMCHLFSPKGHLTICV